MALLIAVAFVTALWTGLAAQQLPDTSFMPPILAPAYPPGAGPTVVVDGGHQNFHTMSGTYRPFALLLQRDGYRVRGSSAGVSTSALRDVDVLVTANAREPFATDEVAAVVEWVNAGGALFLIVDHPPFVASSLALAEAVGVRLHDIGARDPDIPTGRLVFRRADQTLLDHQVTRGIDSVATFTGSALELLAPGNPLFVFRRSVRATTEPSNTTAPSLEGLLQGAVLEFGAGRVAIFGEAAMFSAQLAGPDASPMGINAPVARQNAQFLLNVIHWLTRLDGLP